VIPTAHARDKFCVPITVQFQGEGRARLHDTMCDFLHPKTSRGDAKLSVTMPS